MTTNPHTAPAAGKTAFRQAMSSFPTGITIVTVASSDGAMHGVTASSFSSVSLDPTLVLICLHQASRAAALIERTGAFTVNVLSAGQQHLSAWFANQHRPAGPAMFDGLTLQPGATGCPVLAGAAASFDCQLHHSYPAGDHQIMLGEVIALAHHPHLQPLIYHAGTCKPLKHQSRPDHTTAHHPSPGQDPGTPGQRPHRHAA